MIDAIRRELALATVEPQSTTIVAQALQHVGFVVEDGLSTVKMCMYYLKMASGNPLWVEHRVNDKTLRIVLKDGNLTRVKATPAGLADTVKTCLALVEMEKHHA